MFVGLETKEVTDHIEATEGIEPYLSTSPVPSQSILPSTEPDGPVSTAAPTTTTQSSQPLA